MPSSDKEKHLSELRNKYLSRRLSGLCPVCGVRPKPKDKTLCPDCLRLRNVRTFVSCYGCSDEENAEAWYELCLTGNCDICGAEAKEGKKSRRQLCPDHSHTARPKARGCLCLSCNVKLGVLEHIIGLGGVDVLRQDNPYFNYLKQRDPRYGGCFSPISMLDRK